MDPEAIRRLEAIDFVSSTTLQAVFYGIGFTLYSMCQRLLYKDFRQGDRPRHTAVLFFHSFFVFVLASMSFVIKTHTAFLAYLDHNKSVVGPVVYDTGILKTSSAYGFLIMITGPLSSCLVAAAEIWRIFVIWSESPYARHIIVITIFCYLADVSFFIYSSIAASSLTHTSSVTRIIVCQGMGVITTLLCVLLIAGRIIFVRRRIAQIMEGTLSSLSSGYISIAAILAESYALSAVVSLGAAISSAAFDVRRPALSVFRAITTHVNVIAYFLVLYRVLSGRAWSRDTERQLTTLQWNRQENDTATGASQNSDNRNVSGSLPPDGSLA